MIRQITLTADTDTLLTSRKNPMKAIGTGGAKNWQAENGLPAIQEGRWDAEDGEKWRYEAIFRTQAQIAAYRAIAAQKPAAAAAADQLEQFIMIATAAETSPEFWHDLRDSGLAVLDMQEYIDTRA